MEMEFYPQREKFQRIPNYKDRDLHEGSIYHVIMHGKNLMGSHASQLTVYRTLARLFNT